MSDAQLLSDVSLALRQWRRSWSSSEALRWVESELTTMGSDERSRYEQVYEAAHAAATTDSSNALSNALDAKHARHFLAQCRLSPERMESVMKTVNPNNNSSIECITFVKARPARPALQARAAACALPHAVLHHGRRSAATQSQLRVLACRPCSSSATSAASLCCPTRHQQCPATTTTRHDAVRRPAAAHARGAP